MAGRLAIDFGTSNTVVAVWDESRKEGVPLHVPDLGRWLHAVPASPGSDGRVSVVPSLIHYASDGRRWLGEQVRQRNLYEAAGTFRWMKRYIAQRNEARVRIGARDISHFDAGRDYLSALLTVARGELQLSDDEEIALTVPVESFEHYADWLARVAEEARLFRFRLIDEPSAAALGYGTHIQPGHVYLIVDFGGGTLDVAVVLIEDATTAATGRRCRVLGKSGLVLGGATIDQWLFQKVLEQTGRQADDPQMSKLARRLLVECERAKEELSVRQRAQITILDPHAGTVVVDAEFSRDQFEALLDEHEALAQINRTVDRALRAAWERGFAEDNIQAVLLVGGSSQIPCVQQTIQRKFGRDRVHCHRPMDAVARGAAAFVGGVDLYDHIQHDYAIRCVDPKKGAYDYRIVVKRGTAYPSNGPVAQWKVKASYAGQQSMGLAIFELGEVSRRGTQQPVELIFDPSGGVRVVQLTADDVERQYRFWVNEKNPTFLTANPPARMGEVRFEVTFSIDGNKRLLITARDLKTERLLYRDFPVVKLT